MAAQYLIQPGEGDSVSLGGLGAVFKLAGEATGGSFSLVEHPIAPGALAAPLHTHREVDEVSYVLEGEIGVQVGDDVFTAGPGAVVVKPRGVPHTFWNASAAPARLLEIISPAGFERYFAEITEVLSAGGPPDLARLSQLWQKYGLEMDMASLPELMQKHNVRLM